MQKEHLPFVFGRLCVRKNRAFYTKMIHAFSKRRVKIPQYILQKAESQSGVCKKEILKYLQVLSYKIDKKANFGVERFYRKLRIFRIKPPKRF